ncbi:unnamed protein product [Adineta ricciae]|uniref:Dihydrolipoyllysine-residue succinyltransferase component of 2-oxoglutarate dehydrogenase complex, mitochondrial n=1 Tax=Adineta ricciae TaxID=249248 RepID=A0A815SD23_ADIRI|nr:unnamed protein product [Adineta ricciae]CAF1490502.1 unnamed protein product [Adineta ricciae]
MSHISSLRNASLRALRTTSNVAVASKYTSASGTNRSCQQQQQQQFSYSTLSPSSNRTLTTENSKSSQRTLSDQTLATDSSSSSIYGLVRHLHTSSILLDSVSITTPSFPESVKDGTIRLLKKVGDKVSVDETVAEIETDKVNLSVNAPQSGTITELLVVDGDSVTAGTQIAKLDTSGGDADVKPVQTTGIDVKRTKEESDKSTEKTDSQLTKPKPSTAQKPAEDPKRETSTPAKRTGLPTQNVGNNDPNKITGMRSETRVKMSRMRLKIAERLKEAQNSCAMLTTFNEIDMSNIVEFRKKFADQFQKQHKLKLGFMSAFVKASACALMDNPTVNAVIDGNEIVYRDYVDISVAVASPKGLVVPVLRNVEQMSYTDIERSISEFGEKAKTGTLAIEDMDGGTFTISNGGVFGSLFGTPIINPPQSAILGMHGIFDRPVAINGKIEIRPMMYVALTYDHRILDGRDAVLFLRKIKQYVEDSRSIFLDL